MLFEASAFSQNTADGNALLYAPGVSGWGMPPAKVTASMARRAAQANTSVAKRIFDIVIAATGLFFLWPLFGLIALAIKLDSEGDVFFKQWRYGVNKKKFQIFKFRSMRVMEASGAFRQARKDDDRTTKVGAFLRRTSLDELPQLINVLRGDMSIVGPRPHAIAMDDHYGSLIGSYNERLMVRPGLTGLAQISGFRGPTATEDDINQRLSRDRVYIRTWSIGQDVAIVFKTPIALFKHSAF